MNTQTLVKKLNRLLNFKDNSSLSSSLKEIYSELKSSENKAIKDDDLSFILSELNQINSAKTLERSKYYLNRLLKALSEIKTTKINDINLNRWKDYKDIITDSLWIMERRDKSGAHNGNYWGNFIPQIPNQLFRRFTKKGDWILDCFLGSGTSLIECKRLGRNGIGVELNENVALLANKNIRAEENPFNIKTVVLNDNSSKIDYSSVLNSLGLSSVQFIIMHPPYWDIIKFSDNKDDLSNANTTEEFLNSFGTIVKNVSGILENNRYLAVVIGDKYSSGEWIPLGFLVMQEVLKYGFKLKSTIVKNFEETKGKREQKELWRYRALAGGFYIFKHEYIFLFQKA